MSMETSMDRINIEGRATVPTPSRPARRASAAVLAATIAAAMLAGCSGMTGRAAPPLLAKREIPGVILCMSERTSSGGIRIVGKVDPGIYPISGAAIEYRSAGTSDPVPAIPDPSGKFLVMNGASQETVKYRSGSDEVVFDISPQNARALQDKVLWYRWILTYDRSGNAKIDATDIHRTGYQEAGLPRDPGALGPDGSVALPNMRRR